MNLFSGADLAKRWNYSKAGVSKLIKSKEFPEPLGTINNGRSKVFSETSIILYEKGKPWLFDESQKIKRQNLYCSLSHAKEEDTEMKSKILKQLFNEKAKKWC
jgi:hypothetical protein